LVVRATCLVSNQTILETTPLINQLAHSYQYSFEPNPNWSALYAPAAEIQAYLEGVAKIKECSWDEKLAKWNVTVQNLATGDTLHDQADVVISARGNLNTPSWPDIEGLETFIGEVMHSARWNEG
jgi:cation diffusion facilitator CzcD-associated flavoprotein CzcO